QGVGGGRFAPNALITREQLAAMLVRTLDAEDRATAVGPTMNFPDAGTISSWAPVYVYNAFRQGWMIGDRGGNFRPAENIMRAEVATAVNRMLGRIDHNDERTRLGAALENEYRAATFPDVAVTNWFFASVLGAANDHYLTRDGDEINWKYIRVQ
ncbi:MAG: S-layer homology domain-containing protein, partial [Oscillospiraceae bacterium]|nr:S-layer homology domain-containing protein [Oscillospiraceae bacterium]